MNLNTVEEMLESAKKYAADFDDRAVKSDEHDEYQYNKELADLLRVMISWHEFDR